jgi:hypothetical protein
LEVFQAGIFRAAEVSALFFVKKSNNEPIFWVFYAFTALATGFHKKDCHPVMQKV